MSNNQLSSSTSVSGSAPSVPSPSQLDAELSLSCHDSQPDLALQSNAALTFTKHALSSLTLIPLAPATYYVPASPNLDSTTVRIQRQKDPLLPEVSELSPLCIPAVSATLSSGHTTLVPSPDCAASQFGNGPGKDVVFSPQPDGEDGEIENSGSSSSIEIYLSSLGLENTTPSIFASTVAENEYSASSMEGVDQSDEKVSIEVVPLEMPPAPLHQTIPLPEVTPDREPQSALPSSPSQPEMVFHDHRTTIDTADMTAPVLPTGDSQEFVKDCIDIDTPNKTPNVYINGLPPHFPEEQLYALTAPFGPVRSVRTFTRHVKDSESGYGFVLFETIESAEKCILSLRRYRNLHPTFSKQVHKIPGITCTQLPPPSTEGGPSLSDEWNQKSAAENDISFKEKMESLHDPTSTNLYMEGLPLSIDEATLAALVSPHRISSSRFFQTRLSNPPRIIAFVRLETRAGAEEIIERLHGRMVRGWNDAGSRISVRFADTAEQRELRRTERVNNDGEPSPSRLTIAQAALLNMRGQDLRHRHTSMLPSHQSLPDRLGRLDHALYADFVPSTRRSPTGLTVDFSPDAEYISPGIRRSVSSPYTHQLSLQQIDSSHKVDPSVLTLLDSLRGGRPFPGGDYAARESELQYNIGPRVSHRSAQILEDFGYSTHQYPLRNGYTPTEEYIMRAHAESAAQRRRPPPLDLYRRRRDNEASISMGVRGQRAPASTITLQPKAFVQSDEFQAPAIMTNEMRSRAEQPEICPGTILRPPQVNARVPRDSAQSKQSQKPQVQQSVLQNSDAHQVGHTRSSTLPHRSTFSNQHPRHYQHNSMSVASANSGAHSQDAISAILNSINQNSLTSTSRNKAIHQDTADDHATNDRKEIFQLTNNNRLSYDNTKGSTQLDHRNVRLVRDSSAGIEVEQPSSSLTSPALTYSSQTPSTLSPVTPFVGSFASQSEGFEQVMQSEIEVKRAKVKQ